MIRYLEGEILLNPVKLFTQSAAHTYNKDIRNKDLNNGNESSENCNSLYIS